MEFISHGIFGNFILLKLLILGFKLQIGERGLFGWQNCYLHRTTDDSGIRVESRIQDFLVSRFIGRVVVGDVF